MENNIIKLTHYDKTEKKAHDSQIVRAQENLNLSHGGPSYSQVSGTNPLIKAFRQSQSCHCVWGLTHRPAISNRKPYL